MQSSALTAILRQPFQSDIHEPMELEGVESVRVPCSARGTESPGGMG